MRALYPILAGLMLSTASVAYAEPVAISAVEVAAEADDASNKAALQYYPAVEEDLKASIIAALPPLTGDDSYTVDVRVQSISLDGNPMGADKKFNTLDGWVYVYPPKPAQSAIDDGSAEYAPIDEYKLKLDASAMGSGIQPGTEDFYRAMILAFGQNVGEHIGELDEATFAN